MKAQSLMLLEIGAFDQGSTDPMTFDNVVFVFYANKKTRQEKRRLSKSDNPGESREWFNHVPFLSYRGR